MAESRAEQLVTPVNEDQWQLAQSIFLEALERDAADRDHFLVDRCGDSEELLKEVRSLLDAHERDDGLLGDLSDRAASPVLRSPEVKESWPLPGRAISR